MKKVLFSIVVPVYNRADIIANTINSLLNQDFEDFEIIVVDDGSKDDLTSAIEPFINEKVKFYRKKNEERAAARNFGRDKAMGKYVNFFDSDDIAFPHHLKTAAELIQKHDNPEWFHLGYNIINEKGKVINTYNSFDGETLNHLLHKNNLCSCNGVFIRKDIMEKDRFNTDRDLSASEDYEFWLRLGAKYPLYYSNEITSSIVNHDGRSVSSIPGDKLIIRINSFIKYVQNNSKLKEAYADKLNITIMDAYSYLALHLSDKPPYKLKSVYFLFVSLFKSIKVLTTKRFYATIKNLFVLWN